MTNHKALKTLKKKAKKKAKKKLPCHRKNQFT